MRRSNWKTKVVVVIAFILSVVAGVLLVLVFILVKVLHIGRD